jgi:S1-C subfamily serine protease
MKRLLFGTAAILLGFFAGLVLTGRLHTSSTSEIATAAQPGGGQAAATAPGLARSAVGLPDFTGIAAQAVSAVTNISSSQVVRTPNSPFASDPFFRYFFGDDTDLFGGRDRRETSLGSGVIVSSDGYILTNNHVVEGATDITVQFGADNLTATVVGTDPQTDIAVIRIQRTGLPAATIGSSTDLKVGETVIAIGSPFGLDKTVTSGIVSALHRSDLISGASGISSYTNLIQTDAAINPGNSGGALADLSGAVVGMNTLIQSPSGTLGAAQSAGIGFAIPIDFAKATADTLISGKKVTHPYLGASTVTVTSEAAYYYGLPVSAGAYVQEVANGSPADKAGIQVDDIITRFGTSDVTSVEDLFVAVNASKLGVAVPVELDRNGRTMTVDVTLVAQ